MLRAAAQADGWLVILAAIGLFTREDTARMLRSIGKPMGITDTRELARSCCSTADGSA